MPRIEAATVAEHRALVLERLVDAAEEIMRAGGVDALTAGDVCAAAGIARNGLYRYVKSVDDLKALVVARHLPGWLRAVVAAVEPLDDPRERLLTWARVNLAQAATSGHGWLMGLARSVRPTGDDAAALAGAHGELAAIVGDAWARLCPAHAPSLTAVTNALVSSGFAQLDAGVPLAEVEDVVVGSIAMIIDGFSR